MGRIHRLSYSKRTNFAPFSDIRFSLKTTGKHLHIIARIIPTKCLHTLKSAHVNTLFICLYTFASSWMQCLSKKIISWRAKFSLALILYIIIINLIDQKVRRLPEKWKTDMITYSLISSLFQSIIIN